MSRSIFSTYLKSIPTLDLKIILFLYTLTRPVNGDRQYYIKQLSKYIISDITYVEQYNMLPYHEKKIMGMYQGTFYQAINEYIWFNTVNIDDATYVGMLGKNPFFNMFIDTVFDPVILPEFNRIHKTKSRKFVPSSKFTRKLNTTFNNLYTDTIGLYESHLLKLKTSVTTLYNITTRYPFLHDIILFRGENYDESYTHPISTLVATTQPQRAKRIQQMASFKKNDIIRNNGFVSCSVNPLTAISFAGSTTCCLYRYFVSAGIPGCMIPIEGMEHIEGVKDTYFEFECVFAPHIYKILDIHSIPLGKMVGTNDITLLYTIYDVQIIEMLPMPILR